MRTAQHGVAFDARRQRNRAVDHGAGLLGRVYDFVGGAVQNLMIVCFHPNPNALAREARQRSLLALRRRQPTKWESINLMTARMTVKVRMGEFRKKWTRSPRRGTSHRPV